MTSAIQCTHILCEIENSGKTETFRYNLSEWEVETLRPPIGLIHSCVWLLLSKEGVSLLVSLNETMMYFKDTVKARGMRGHPDELRRAFITCDGKHSPGFEKVRNMLTIFEEKRFLGEEAREGVESSRRRL